jgi:hypothetical protein
MLEVAGESGAAITAALAMARTLIVRAGEDHRSISNPMPAMDVPRVRAPEFPAGLDWIGTDGRALTMADLRGKVTILDFWTYG